MGIDRDLGEHSQSTNSDGERPFKKAKYAWQVKGKSHLKETSNTKSTQDEENIEKKPETNKRCASQEAKRCHGYKCVMDVFVNKILNPSECLMVSDDDEDIDDASPKLRRKNQVPISMVPKIPKTYDHYLAKWQARKVAISYIENTINRALEESPYFKMLMKRIAPFEDATDFVENCENGGMVEDEGILMAIQSHGLQSQSNFIRRSFEEHHHHMNTIDPDVNSSDSASDEIGSSPELSECTCKTKQLATQHQHRNDQDDLDLPTPSTEKPREQSPTSFEHFDFLSTAVAVAIQKKGLNF